jgi:hypothetical protein
MSVTTAARLVTEVQCALTSTLESQISKSSRHNRWFNLNGETSFTTSYSISKHKRSGQD